MSSVNTGRWLMSRREVLRGLGVSLSLPLFDCMIPPGRAEGAGAAPAMPKRSVFLYVPNGKHMPEVLKAMGFNPKAMGLKPQSPTWDPHYKDSPYPDDYNDLPSDPKYPF